MPLDPLSLVVSRPRLALLTLLALVAVVAAVALAGLADAALMATAPAGDGPLMAPFRWAPLSANLA
jgi:hypothetical protein